MSSFSDASISFSDVSSISEGSGVITRPVRPQSLQGRQRPNLSAAPMPTSRREPPPVKRLINHDTSPSISFDESMLGYSGDIVVGGKPPLPSGRPSALVAAAPPLTKGRAKSGLPPKPERRLTNDSFSISGSLDFSDDQEVGNSSTNGNPNPRVIDKRALPASSAKAKLHDDDDASFEISGDLSFSGEIELDQPTSAAPLRGVRGGKSSPHPAAVLAHVPVMSKIKGQSAVRLSSSSISIDLDQVSFGSSGSVSSFGHKGNSKPYQQTPMQSSQPQKRLSLDSDDIHFSGEDDDDDSLSSGAQRRIEASRLRRPTSALDRPSAAALRRGSMSSHTPSVSGESPCAPLGMAWCLILLL